MSLWYAVQTTSGQEARVIDAMIEKGVTFYLPQQVTWRRFSRPRKVDGVQTDKVKAESPLFPGYMFALLPDNDDDREPVAALDGVRGFVSAPSANGERHPFPIPAAAVHRIMADERAGLFDKTRPTVKRYRPSKGDRIVVAGGPFMGYLATVISEVTEKTKRARVELHGLGGGAMPLDVAHMARAA